MSTSTERYLGAPPAHGRSRPSCQAVMSVYYRSAAVQRALGASWLWCDSPALCERVYTCMTLRRRALAVTQARNAVRIMRM